MQNNKPKFRNPLTTVPENNLKPTTGLRPCNELQEDLHTTSKNGRRRQNSIPYYIFLVAATEERGNPTDSQDPSTDV